MELETRFRQALEEKGIDYKPRTHHLLPDGQPKYTNRLIFETSPYLLQHAHNPVNWRAWGDEAFEEAQKLGRPVLLSVGYSTCHWCHVMEAESFEDEEIARFINEHYIAIKVDREERPDVDAVYMKAVQALTGRGGWPMTVWLTPAREPFYGGTYFPARDGDRGAPVGFLSILGKLHQAYLEQPDQIMVQAQLVSRAIKKSQVAYKPGEVPGREALDQVFTYSQSHFDSVSGGLAGAPKFPSNLPVRILLRYFRRSGETGAKDMAALTLEKMARGGMYDQAGGGFHRYSTDSRWLVPHFEKMLYDNALLTTAYLEGYQALGREDFADTAKDILHYVKRDMTSTEGAFFSATDADSLTPSGHMEEGYYFTWTPAEIDEALDEKSAGVVKAYYDITPSGNFEGRNILHVPVAQAKVAKQLGISLEELKQTVKQANDVLRKKRMERPAPLRDEKILTSWNALMISAFAQAGLMLGDHDYTQSAVRAAEFIGKNLMRDGRLLHSYKDGQATIHAFLDDYTFFIAALLDLYEATSDSRWLAEALRLEKQLEQNFWDEQDGGFFMTASDQEKVLVREKPSYDNATPSGNSVAALNLLRLNEFTTDDAFRIKAEKIFRSFQAMIKEAPAAFTDLLLALDFHLDDPFEIVLVAPEGKQKDAETFISRMRKVFLPNRILAVAGEGDELESLAKLVPLVGQKTARNGKATAYVCQSGVCQNPATEPEIFLEQIRQVRSYSDAK